MDMEKAEIKKNSWVAWSEDEVTGETIENTPIRPEEKKAKGKDVKVLPAYLAVWN